MSGATLLPIRDGGQAAAVIFLHGFGGDAQDTWANFPGLLKADRRLTGWDLFSIGYPTGLRLDVPGIWSANPDIPKLAQEMVTRLTVPPLLDYKSVAIIAHSMGGLVAQQAVLNPRLAGRIGHLVLFGTPSAGLKKAGIGRWFNRQATDMTAGGTFITALRTEWTTRFGAARPFGFRAVAGDRDEFVPADSSLDPFPEEVQEVVPGNHLEIVKPDAASHPSVGVVLRVLTGQSPARNLIDSARLAVETRQFQKAVDLLLGKAPSLDEGGLAQLALALDGLGRGTEALEVLQQRQGKGPISTDTMGILAGRIKRRWLAGREAADWQRARELYGEALAQSQKADPPKPGQVYYHAINVAFLELMHDASPGLPPEAKRHAELALEAAARTADEPGSAHWRIATEAEAMMILGRLDEAVARYQDALDTRPGPRAVQSMYSQALEIAGRVYGEIGERALARLEGFGPRTA